MDYLLYISESGYRKRDSFYKLIAGYSGSILPKGHPG